MKNWKRICEGAFKCCKKLKKITIPDSVLFFENEVFSGCSKLTDIKISNKIASIGKLCFEDCIEMEKIKIPSEYYIYVDKKCFQNCTSLTKVTIDTNKVTIENDIFTGCMSFTVLIIDTKDQKFSHFSSVPYRTVTHVIIPENVRRLSEKCFMKFIKTWVTVR